MTFLYCLIQRTAVHETDRAWSDKHYYFNLDIIPTHPFTFMIGSLTRSSKSYLLFNCPCYEFSILVGIDKVFELCVKHDSCGSSFRYLQMVCLFELWYGKWYRSIRQTVTIQNQSSENTNETIYLHRSIYLHKIDRKIQILSLSERK